MSDAKSAAEARRAKILARANSKTNTVSVASSEDVTDVSGFLSLIFQQPFILLLSYRRVFITNWLIPVSLQTVVPLQIDVV